jgi:hypothetical protein
MSDKPKIPSWQRAAPESPLTTLTEAAQESEQHSEPTEQPELSTSPVADAPTPTEDDLEEPETTTLLDQAQRFLDDATIRDAPREKKAAFLESKGVSAGDIETLLGAESQEKPSVEMDEAGERAWSTVSLTSSHSRAPTPWTACAIHCMGMTDLCRHLLSQSKHHDRAPSLSRHRALRYHPSSHTPSSSLRPRSHRHLSRRSAC